jgi:hypothetical protein
MFNMGILDCIEFSIYVVYIYFLIILAILIKPNIITTSILVFYVYPLTWIILSNADCVQISALTKFIVSCIYTVGCVVAYHLTNYIYWHSPQYKLVLLFAPVMFFFTIKFWLYLLNCNPYSNIKYAIQLTTYGLGFLNKLITG